MFFNFQNIIDKKILQTFPENILENLDYEKLDYFGINISSDINKDFAFKIYYKNQYSKKLYSKAEKIPFIEFLIGNRMLNFLTLVHNETNIGYSKYDAGLKTQSNRNMKLLFSYLKENCPFYNKYEKEILELSRMKVNDCENIDYRSLNFLALIENKTLKCHWFNRACMPECGLYNNEYYFDFIENSSVKGLKKILPKAKTAIQNTQGNIWMEGIDYTEHAAQKYKIYIYQPKDTFDGLIKTYSDNIGLMEKLKIIKEWLNLHQELYCNGFALGEDTNGNSTINLYFRLRKD